MQYILSEEEYQDLRFARERKFQISEAKLQKLCTRIANEMPIVVKWCGPEAKPWGCVITAAEEGDEWYCDSCPVKDICPNDSKEFSQ